VSVWAPNACPNWIERAMFKLTLVVSFTLKEIIELGRVLVIIILLLV
jgi:hypothetical protein